MAKCPYCVLDYCANLNSLECFGLYLNAGIPLPQLLFQKLQLLPMLLSKPLELYLHVYPNDPDPNILRLEEDGSDGSRRGMG